MKGIFIHCQECKKILLKNAYVRNGSQFDLRCYFCGSIFHLSTAGGEVYLTVLTKERKIEPEPTKDDYFFLET